MTMSRRMAVSPTKAARLATTLALGAAATCATLPLVAASRANAQAVPARVAGTASERLEAFRKEVTRLVNVERSKRGLGAMRISDVLNSSAQAHARDMARNDYFDHASLDGRSPFERILDAGYKGGTMGENIAAGQTNARDVMKGWMESEGHRANILSPQFREIGVGYAFDESSQFGSYWVQNFGGSGR